MNHSGDANPNQLVPMPHEVDVTISNLPFTLPLEPKLNYI